MHLKDSSTQSRPKLKARSIDKIFGQLLMLNQDGADMKDIIKCYELFPVPLALFHSNGKPRQTQKAV